MAWPSMEDKILPASLDLPFSSSKASGAYLGLGYSAPERGVEALKATWAAIPSTPISIAYHVRGKTAFICADMDPRPFKKHLKGDECYTHSLPLIWVKYEFAPQQQEAKSGQARKKARKEARAQAPSRSPLHPPAPGPDAGGVVCVRGGGGEADPLLHEAEEEVCEPGVQGD